MSYISLLFYVDSELLTNINTKLKRVIHPRKSFSTFLIIMYVVESSYLTLAPLFTHSLA